ncbi:histidine phosphatase family protein [Microbacterium sp. zg.Y1090]|uniref:SixA phosphatase family protein n=1 Tax=Microbacterium TaxID=33882 RepID=UPI00214B72E3|nr:MULTISPECIES: histidine phosphatase family protein [unclassified Microbacterium]MCR2812967.1 histidine phosphatase family protein [Microbacterium sp. zg.Y1084]MCR2817223.1 histidine phosphatase family protein [Microbacterium sp. zg.Y1090]MDL5486108.1 histidine phosphatase family protein [Microbacterium sp. zg-Y1211]WIM29286.1 histidine phosphatase family protein [Microbacterium sp. zg-Y1090]
MIRLALVRHAKSDWGDPGLPDHDRPLNPRGLRDAPVMAARLADSGFAPDLIVASTALRARTTAEIFADRFGLAPLLRDELYGAGADELLRTAATQGVASVLLVAHDPGMSALAGRLAPEIAHMPTCAVATFTWDQDDWDVASALDPDAWTFDSPR